jgi:hypothetical protein
MALTWDNVITRTLADDVLTRLFDCRFGILIPDNIDSSP